MLCCAEQIIDIIRALTPRACQILRQHLGSVMLKNATEDSAFLVQYYTSAIAEKKLAYYEKCMQVMESLEIEQFATIAGNLALVYRRRNEEEKTFRYHTTSMELYQKSGETKEYLIEMLNMSTAYRHFYRREEAIQLLQKGIKEAGEANAKNIEAAMAGNLALLLSQKHDPALVDEIMQYFAIEEQYFRCSGEDRDLVISLLNQLNFYRDSKKANGDIEKKLEEAKKLIRKNHFDEFEHAVASLSRILMESDLSQRFL